MEKFHNLKPPKKEYEKIYFRENVVVTKNLPIPNKSGAQSNTVYYYCNSEEYTFNSHILKKISISPKMVFDCAPDLLGNIVGRFLVTTTFSRK